MNVSTAWATAKWAVIVAVAGTIVFVVFVVISGVQYRMWENDPAAGPVPSMPNWFGLVGTGSFLIAGVCWLSAATFLVVGRVLEVRAASRLRAHFCVRHLGRDGRSRHLEQF